MQYFVFCVVGDGFGEIFIWLYNKSLWAAVEIVYQPSNPACLWIKKLLHPQTLSLSRQGRGVLFRAWFRSQASTGRVGRPSISSASLHAATAMSVRLELRGSGPSWLIDVGKPYVKRVGGRCARRRASLLRCVGGVDERLRRVVERRIEHLPQCGVGIAFEIGADYAVAYEGAKPSGRIGMEQ